MPIWLPMTARTMLGSPSAFTACTLYSLGCVTCCPALEDAGLHAVRLRRDLRRVAALHRALELRVDDRLRERLAPSREALRRGLHVVLGEGVRAHREQFHELARVVLVRVASGRRRE